MSISSSPASPEAKGTSPTLSVPVKLAYGAGELGPALVGNMIIFYLLFFLTNIAGIPPALAGIVPMVGKIWDAINDPLIGWLSDRTKSKKWGRRLSWMVVCLAPFVISVVAMWWVPPWEGQWARFWYYVAVVIFYNAVSSGLTVPHTSLMPELTADYEERTNLVSYRSGFSIFGSVGFILLAWMAGQFGLTGEMRYLVLGGLCAAVLTGTVIWCVLGIRNVALKRERYLQGRVREKERFPISQQLRVVFTNRPFLFVCAVFTFSWLAVQVTASVLVYYAVYWVGMSEDQVPLLMLTVMGTAVATLPLWVRLSHRFGKKLTFTIGIGLWLLAQTGLVFSQPAQTGWTFVLAFVAGIGVSTAYLIPWALVPEVIEYDELQTGRRREGLYYGFMVLLQKVGLGLAIFLVGLTLEAAGFVSQKAGQPPPDQPESALLAIRLAIGPLPAVALALGLICAWLYPLNKERYAEILRKLEERRA